MSPDRSDPDIVLMRHGRPSCPAGGWLSASGFADWVRRYDLAPVVEPAPRPAEAAASGAVVFCSPLQRSRSSARLIAFPERIIEDEIFREAALATPAPGEWPRLPVPLWLALARAKWLCGVGDAAEHARDAATRAARAAQLLEQAARRDGRAVLVGHGWFNRMIGARLAERGWRASPPSSSGFWGMRRYALGDKPSR